MINLDCENERLAAEVAALRRSRARLRKAIKMALEHQHLTTQGDLAHALRADTRALRRKP